MKQMGREKYHSKTNKLKASNQESQTDYGIALSKGSMPSLCKSIQQWFEAGELKAGYNRDVALLVSDIPTEVIADLTCRVVLDCISVGQPLTATAIKLGSFLEEEARLRKLKTESPASWNLIKNSLKKRVGFDYKKYSSRALAARLNLGKDWESWETSSKCRTGLVFVDLFQKSTGLVELVTIINGVKKVPHLQPTEKTKEWLKLYEKSNEDLAPIYLPCSKESGYKALTTCTFKISNKEHLKKLDSQPLSIPYSALTKLQATPWQINKVILDTAQYFWKNQYSIAGFPPFKDDLRPSKPHDIETNKESRDNWRQATAEFYRNDLSLKGSRLAVSKILWVADKFRHEESMYYPHQFDFRGRAYAVPNFLNFQTTDLSKGLLQFSKPGQMTERGKFWFVKTGAALWGSSEAEDWIKTNKENIHSVAQDPTGNTWWAKAKEPWQFLAWCLEASLLLKNNLRETRLPISVDASSNGLQIMSMLMRYKEGAKATNCISRHGAKPRDIYEEILNKIKQEIEGSTLGHHWLNLSIDRDLIKSIIMTIPYGITKFRATELVLHWYWKTDKPFGDKAGKECEFLASLIIDTFYKMFPEFQKLMKLLESVGTVKSWVSPSGFPVFQYYHKSRQRKLKSLLFGKIRSFNFYDETEEEDTTKMRRAFVPNFIHSLDASVMHIAIQRFKGSSIASVHDSFATHVTDMDELLQTLKDANADLFGADPEVFWRKIFRDLPLEKQAYSDFVANFLAISGDLVVDEIRQSAYMYR